MKHQQLLLHLQDLSLQHITNILWTYASFLHDVPDMLPAFTSQILERSHKEQFNAQQLSNLLWSLCILQVCPLWPWVISEWPWALGPGSFVSRHWTGLFVNCHRTGPPHRGPDTAVNPLHFQATHFRSGAMVRHPLALLHVLKCTCIEWCTDYVGRVSVYYSGA